jgi:hypothetical protein
MTDGMLRAIDKMRNTRLHNSIEISETAGRESNNIKPEGSPVLSRKIPGEEIGSSGQSLYTDQTFFPHITWI